MAKMAKKHTGKASSSSAQVRGATIEDAYNKIKNMIYLNKLAPSQKIVCKDLANQLNLSITPVVQALNRLEASGFVDYIPNRGYFMGEITWEEANQLYEAREALEVYIVPAVVSNITQEKVRQTRATFKKFAEEFKAPPNSRKFILVDAQFHLELAAYSGNEVICRMLRDVFEKIYLKYRPEYLGTARIKEIQVEHRQILQALLERDVEAVQSAIREHITTSKQRVTHMLRVHEEEDLL